MSSVRPMLIELPETERNTEIDNAALNQKNEENSQAQISDMARHSMSFNTLTYQDVEESGSDASEDNPKPPLRRKKTRKKDCFRDRSAAAILLWKAWLDLTTVKTKRRL
ncbi:hypothetical protein PI125_g9802 [Phytophthora idaei]|nr:hypothetical protein PI125_g9802 [Phytophthora idaei]KAG3155706.1 hypothetical protein PI126_g9066 [Phytophthora idaei]